MMTHYNKGRKATLLQKCHRTFLDCVDYQQSPFDKVIKAFDFFSQIYCSKFEEGQIDSIDQERSDEVNTLGIYRMI